MSDENTFTAEGYLNFESQEGGYADPSWRLDGGSLVASVIRYFGLKRITWEHPKWQDEPFVPGDVPAGRVRITIERLKGEK